MKNKILNFSYEQMLEVEHDLNEWKWNDLLGDKPKGFDELPDYPFTWYQECNWYKKLFNHRTKYDYVHPIRKYITHFTNEMEDIIESNRLKKEAVENCKDALKDKLTPEQLQKFEDVFYTAAKKYLFSRKKENANKENQ